MHPSGPGRRENQKSEQGQGKSEKRHSERRVACDFQRDGTCQEVREQLQGKGRDGRRFQHLPPPWGTSSAISGIANQRPGRRCTSYRGNLRLRGSSSEPPQPQGRRPAERPAHPGESASWGYPPFGERAHVCLLDYFMTSDKRLILLPTTIFSSVIFPALKSSKRVLPRMERTKAGSSLSWRVSHWL